MRGNTPKPLSPAYEPVRMRNAITSPIVESTANLMPPKNTAWRALKP